MKNPDLQEGEVYIGAIVGADGHGHHVILLPEHPDKNFNWQAAIDWAKSVGGDLPTRVEQSLLFDQHKSQFDNDWYWSNTQHAAYADYSWYQGFGYGSQYDGYKSNTLRARAVRRVPV